jgi:glycosyltransferase involved in cell wall biosynthesis
MSAEDPGGRGVPVVEILVSNGCVPKRQFACRTPMTEKKAEKELKVLILCPYPKGSAAGQRFRYEQYLEILRKANIETVIEAFLSARAMEVLYEPGHNLRKTWNVVAGFCSRCRLMFRVFGYDYIFIFREASPLGPPIFEFLLFLLKRRVIYDFDDAIFICRKSRANRLAGRLKWTSKVAYITRHSHKVAVCNQYLVDWASQYNHNTVLIPTTIDPSYHKPLPKKRDGQRLPVIGWTGSQSNLSYLEIVRPVLKTLEKKYDFEFRVICDLDPGFPELKHYRFLKWRKETEIADLGSFDIGLMPVPEGSWEKGKVGFKGIQYSALEIVPVVSSVGSGHEVVENEKTGLVVDNNESEWYQALERLLRDPDRAVVLGQAARAKILEEYSVPSQANAYLSLFQ